MLRIALFFTVVAMSALFICSCGSKPSPESEGKEDEKEVIIPNTAITGRDPTKFSNFSYSAPDKDELIRVLEDAAAAINRNDSDLESQVELLKAAKKSYVNYLTMHSYAELQLSFNQKNESFKKDYRASLDYYHKVLMSYEKLQVAAAQSPHFSGFEEEVFGIGKLEEFKSGEKLCDISVELLKKEEELKISFKSLSEDNVFISYSGVYSTYKDAVERIKEQYKDSAEQLEIELLACKRQYEATKGEIALDIFIELAKIRQQIASEAGYDSYTEFAYDRLGYSYSTHEMQTLVDSIRSFALPIRAELTGVFDKYFYTNKPSEIATKNCFYSIYKLYSRFDCEVSRVFSYMFTRELYSIENAKEHRSDSSFIAYLPGYDAPFVFVTAGGNIRDYLTIAAHFGEFVDVFHSREKNSHGFSQFSSKGLELITLSALSETLTLEDYKFLLYTVLDEAIDDLVSKSFSVRLEEAVYALPAEQITKTAVKSIIDNIAVEYGFDDGLPFQPISECMINEPFSDQCCCLATLSALELYFIGNESADNAMNIYYELTRSSGGDYFEELKLHGLSDPFDPDFLKSMLDEIHYTIKGYHYFTDDEGSNAA